MKLTMFVRTNSLITNLRMNSSTCLQISFVVDTPWLIERLEEEAQKEYPEKLRYVLRDLAVKKELLLTNTQDTWQTFTLFSPIIKPISICLNLKKVLLFFSPNQKIYTKVKNEEPTYYANTSKVSTQFASGSIIEGEVVQSVLSRNIYVHKDSVVKDSILFPRVVIGQGAQVEYAILDKGVEVADGVSFEAQQNIQL